MSRDSQPLGQFELVVLLAVLQVADDAYGVTVHEELVRRTKRRVGRGAVYMTLDRLEKKGLLSSSFSDPTPDRGGKAKRRYQLTKAALRALTESRREWLSLWDGLQLAQ
jgi:DNA-binding PadR family transcriptional regulator